MFVLAVGPVSRSTYRRLVASFLTHYIPAVRQREQSDTARHSLTSQQIELVIIVALYHHSHYSFWLWSTLKSPLSPHQCTYEVHNTPDIFVYYWQLRRVKRPAVQYYRPTLNQFVATWRQSLKGEQHITQTCFSLCRWSFSFCSIPVSFRRQSNLTVCYTTGQVEREDGTSVCHSKMCRHHVAAHQLLIWMRQNDSC